MREVKRNCWYRHFKGARYYVTDVGVHTETGERFVVYKGWNPAFLCFSEATYIRPIDMFLSKVDLEKHPRATQKFRFEEEKRGEKY